MAVRDRQRRNLMATLLLSQGVPMLLAGDEIGRTQRGNNNAYCQDNEVSWLDWVRADAAFQGFCRELITYRSSNPVLRRSYFLTGVPNGRGLPDAAWFTPSAQEMGWEHWSEHLRQVVVWLNGELEESGPRGERIRGTTVLMAFNADEHAMEMVVPAEKWGRSWRVRIDTAEAGGAPEHGAEVGPQETLAVHGRSLVLLELLER